MENQYEDGIDLISQLPRHILHHIITFLSQKEAVQTSVLSKSWRFLGCTRPNVEFLESHFRGKTENFLYALDKTLQGYRDRELCMQKFLVDMEIYDSDTDLFLLELIPKVISWNKGLKMFHLCLFYYESEYFDLPSIVFESESLQKLFLKECKLDRINSFDLIQCRHLQTLCLSCVSIAGETLEMILSSCLLIEHVSLVGCVGFKAIKMDKPNGLKYFEIECWTEKQDDFLSVDVNFPSIETIKLTACRWFRHNNYFLPHVTSLSLSKMSMSKELFKFFSGNYLPRLQHLALDSCFGFEELHMCFTRANDFMESCKSATNIVEFVYGSKVPREWKSKIIVSSDSYFSDNVSSWFRTLHELLDALNQSENPLQLNQCLDMSHVEKGPVVVEHLSLKGFIPTNYTSPENSVLCILNCLFRFFRPTSIGRHEQWERHHTSFGFLLDYLQTEREMRQYDWAHELEKVIMCENEQKQPFGQGPKVRLIWIEKRENRHC